MKDRTEPTTVIPGVNFTKHGIVMIDLNTWARLKVYGLLQVDAVGGRTITIRHSGYRLRKEV